MTLEHLLNYLSQEYNFPISSIPNTKESYSLEIDSSKLCFKTIDSTFILSALIAALPLDNPELILTLAMKGNFMNQGTGDSAICLTEDESFLTLVTSLPYEISYSTFKEKIEEFVNFLEFWKGLIHENSKQIQ